MKNNEQKVLKQLNITNIGKQIENYYVVELDDYESFVKLYNQCEKADFLTKDSSMSFLNNMDMHIQYNSDNNVIVELVALLDEDNYTINLCGEED